MAKEETRRLASHAAALVLVGSTLVASDGAADPPRDVRGLARLAIAVDAGAREDAIRELRALGTIGLDALFSEHGAIVDRLRRGDAAVLRSPAAERVRRAIDRVAAQRDAHASGLYWHTRIEDAIAEARRTHKPILSLRLLGRLDEELSCANSRLFRTTLYPNREVAAHLARHFVLHWSSERPAPRITIDMGDGRRIERTITGNSVHYVLDARGRPVDAIPGLYTPRAFLDALDAARGAARRCGSKTDESRGRCLSRWHEARIAALDAAWERERAERPWLPPSDRLLASPDVPVAAIGDAAPSAMLAERVTVSKAAIEMPMMRMMAREPAIATAEARSAAFRAIAEARARSVALDAATRALLRLKRGADAPRALESRLVEMAAEDAVRNEQVLHRRIHRLIAGAPRASFERLNALVYRDIFLTPADDPWLGLRADDLWDGADGEAGDPS